MRRLINLTVAFGLGLLSCADDGFDPGPDGGTFDISGGFEGGPQRPSCPGQQSTISGTVLAPNGSDPVPGATIFVPSQVPEMFPPEVKCEVCGSLGTGYNFWTTTSAFDGTFTLEGVCPGQRSLVLQNGRFRRYLQLNVAASSDVELTPAQSRLPTRDGEQHPIDAVPRIAVATGDYDKMECVLKKLGLDQSAYDLYEGASLLLSPTPLPSFASLVGSLDKMKQYNIIFINCTDNTFEEELQKAKVRENIDDYVNAGGRLYVTDWSYDWVEQIGSLAKFIDFEPDDSDSSPEPVNGAALGKAGLQIKATIKDSQMAQWLGLFPGAIDANDQSPVEHFLPAWVMMRKLHKEVKLWVEGPVSSADNAITGTKPLTVTFNFENCGKVLYTSYHTEGRDDESPIFPLPFPDYCNTSASPQDRILEYLIFDIASCIKPID